MGGDWRGIGEMGDRIIGVGGVLTYCVAVFRRSAE